MELPKVAVILINSRDNDFYKLAKDSILKQVYPDFEYIEEYNKDRTRTVGKCWNDAVKKTDADLCLFVGDDDYITPDYIISLVAHYLNIKPHKDEIVGATSYITAFDKEKKTRESLKFYPTGMFERQYLLKNPFDEKLKKMVDTEYYKTLTDNNLAVAYWNFGYHYRQHDGMISGRCIQYVEEKDGKNNFKK